MLKEMVLLTFMFCLNLCLIKQFIGFFSVISFNTFVLLPQMSKILFSASSKFHEFSFHCATVSTPNNLRYHTTTFQETPFSQPNTIHAPIFGFSTTRATIENTWHLCHPRALRAFWILRKLVSDCVSMRVDVTSNN